MNIPAPSKTIICFGDSNTHGYNSSTGNRFSESEGWPCLLGSLLGENYRVIEEGLCGRTTVFDDPLFEGLSGLSYLSPCLMTHEPVDLLIIMLGTNDVKERFGATPDNIAKGLDRLVRKALDTTSAWRNTPNILVLSPPPIHPLYTETSVAGEMGRGCAEKSAALSALYRKTAETLHCHFLDAGSIPGVSMYPYDHMHLSADAHRLLAEELSRLIPELMAV